MASGLAQQGYGKQSLAYTDQMQKQAQAQAATQKTQLETKFKQLELGSQLLGGVKDQASYDAARAEAQAYGLDVSGMQLNYDPAFVASKLRKGMAVKDQLAQELKEMEFTTPTANALLTSQTSRQNNQDTINNQSATAKMTDARAREFNATKVEENNLKREAKQETADLTKSSQLASFDTMLGTLDRLGKHAGLKSSVGFQGAFPTMPGSESANFQAELNTFQSQAFLPMVAQLKGMGALSDSEGKKLTAAVGALDPKMGEQAFRDSIARITADMQAARQRMSGAGQAGLTGGSTGSFGEPSSAPMKIKDANDYAKLPKGAMFISPDGKMRTKQ